MLYGRTIRTKLPELCQLENTSPESRDREWETKEKGKMYTDARRNAQENDIKEGDLVLMKQKKTDKLSTNFNLKPMKTVSKGKKMVYWWNFLKMFSTEEMLHISRSL